MNRENICIDRHIYKCVVHGQGDDDVGRLEWHLLARALKAEK